MIVITRLVETILARQFTFLEFMLRHVIGTEMRNSDLERSHEQRDLNKELRNEGKKEREYKIEKSLDEIERDYKRCTTKR